MKRKIGTLLEEEVIKLAKYRAVQEGKPLNELIQDALIAYLNSKAPDRKTSEAAYQLFCERPINLSHDQFKELLEEDSWDV